METQDIVKAAYGRVNRLLCGTEAPTKEQVAVAEARIAEALAGMPDVELQVMRDRVQAARNRIARMLGDVRH